MAQYTVIILILCLSEITLNLASEKSNVSISDVCDSRDKKCIWKCCPPGLYKLGTRCVPYNKAIHFTNITVYDEQLERTNKSFEDVFQLEYSETISNANFGNNSINAMYFSKVYLVENGHLYFEIPNSFERWFHITPDGFCVDFNVRTKTLVCLIGSADTELDEERMYTLLNMLECALGVSIFFLLLSVIPYCWCSQLRDLDGVILAMFITAYTGPLILEAMSLYTQFTTDGVIAIAMFYHFFTVSSFCWTNIMFYRLRTSSEEYTPVSRLKQFLKYCVYAVVLPLSLTSVMAAAELTDLSDVPWLITPQIVGGASYTFRGKESLVYLHIPLLPFLVFNWIVCIKKLVEFYQNPRDIPMSVLTNEGKPLESPLTGPSRYEALLVVLTIGYIMQTLSAYSPEGIGHVLVYIMFIVTICMGPAIFGIFVVNKKVLDVLKDCFTKRKRGESKVFYENDDNVTIG